MSLMERVAMLLRANLNDLLSRAEDPEKLVKQLVLDMENQLLQVKTQVAMALADQHLLERKAKEQESELQNWQRKAELAVRKGDDVLARAALQRVLEQQQLLEAFRKHVTDQSAEAAALRNTYTKLQSKLAETNSRCELLIAQNRRAGVVRSAAEAHAKGAGTGGEGDARAIGRLRDQILESEALNKGLKQLAPERSVEERLEQLEKNDRVEQLLAELKGRQHLLPTG